MGFVAAKMHLPEWCQTHTLMEFLELIEFGSFDPKTAPNGAKKGKKMNEINTDQAAVPVDIANITVEPELPEELRRIAQKLAEDGEVLVQTTKVAGTEDTAHTVH